jgi:1-acyl-sn-glycerol-3-phosphate acyltransferase
MTRPTREERYPGMTRGQVWTYAVCRSIIATILLVLYRLRRLHADRVPQSGPVILVSNHQSHFDPPAVGSSIGPRSCAYVARASLYDAPVFGRLIRALNTIPVRKGEANTSAIKKTLAKLEIGSPVMVFPEGSRTFDGELQPFMRGALVLVKKSGAPVVPVGIAGFFDVWPRTRTIPRILTRKRVAVCFGHPIPAKELLTGGPDAAMDRLHDEIAALSAEAGRAIGKPA